MRILIAEDDERLADVIARGLRKQSYAVSDRVEGLNAAAPTINSVGDLEVDTRRPSVRRAGRSIALTSKE